MQAPSNRRAGYREHSAPVVRPNQRVFLLGRSKEDAGVDPLRLDELELPLQMGSHEDEQSSPLGPIVLEDAFRKRRAIAGATTHDAVQEVDSNEPVLERVSRIRPADVRADGAAQASRVVIVVKEVVVATGVGAALVRVIVMVPAVASAGRASVV